MAYQTHSSYVPVPVVLGPTQRPRPSFPIAANGTRAQPTIAPAAPNPQQPAAHAGTPAHAHAHAQTHAQTQPPISTSTSNQTHAHASNHVHAPQPPPQTQTQTQSAPFRAPAHKHAHHLHSIPPREKSTRTLILDHLLWVHARTRFAQARAELAMTDRTGGPAAPHYAHRERPEGYDEDAEAPSDGEDVAALLARAGGPGHPHDEDEEARMARQDFVLARKLRLRAEGIEKVVASMLEQPPQDHPFPDDEPLLPPAPTSPRQPLVPHVPTSPVISTASAAALAAAVAATSYASATALPPTAPAHAHTLPNGVRLRLALATVLNDLFARQAPIPRHLHVAAASRSSTSSTASGGGGGGGGSPAMQAQIPRAALPPSLLPLSTVSSASASYAPAYSGYASPPQRAHRFQIQYTSYAPPSPSPRTRDMFLAGADPSTANSPPSLRCPRHLHTGCDICVEAKDKAPARPRGGTVAAAASAAGKAAVGGGVPQGGGLTGFKDGSGVGSGLARPGPRGSVLRRQVSGMGAGAGGEGRAGAGGAGAGGAGEEGKTTGTGNTRLSELIARFVRLSALVSLELGREAGVGVSSGYDDASDEAQGHGQGREAGSAAKGAYARALRPAREWYMLLAGLLTRAVLEGYLSAGWRQLAPVQVLMGVGLGLGDAGAGAGMDMGGAGAGGADEFAGFDPDELPDLEEAVRVLFPALRAHAEAVAAGGGAGTCPRREGGEAEYEREMMARLARFFDVPAGTPDLSTHMEDLAWQYPAEPVERAALRFCEAIAKWRGRPELETYKERPPGYTPAPPGPHGHGQAEAEAAASGAGARGGRPPIERYFVMPPHAQGRAHPQQSHHQQQQQGHGQGQARKRGRSVVERGASPSAWRADKRAYVGAGGAA